MWLNILTIASSADIAELVFGIVVFFVLMFMGLIFGGIAERKHLASITQRTAEFSDMLITDMRTPIDADAHRGGTLVMGEVVVGSDYLKTWLAGIRHIFGGEIRGFDRLMYRAREEARLRLMEEAKQLGYNAVCNLRIEFVGLGGSATGGKGAPMAGVIASGTAYVRLPTA